MRLDALRELNARIEKVCRGLGDWSEDRQITGQFAAFSPF
jgi:hypothetical protein